MALSVSWDCGGGKGDCEESLDIMVGESGSKRRAAESLSREIYPSCSAGCRRPFPRLQIAREGLQECSRATAYDGADTAKRLL